MTIETAYVPPLLPTHLKDIIILNGPPGSGKDYLCQELQEQLGSNIKHLEVKKRLFELALAISNMPVKQWWQLYNNRDTKEVPHKDLFGLSPRQFMIYVSEDIMKPLAGKDYFGQFAAKEAHAAKEGILVFTDGGFEAEVKELSKYGNIHLIHLHRKGATFEGDSRSYLPVRDYVATHLELHNDGAIADIADSIRYHLSDFWNGKL